MIRPVLERISRDANHLLNLAYRAFEFDALEESSAPIAFMNWAQSVSVEFHPDWWDAVSDGKARVKTAEVPAPAPPRPDLKTKEQNTLLKMVVGMAMGGYGWDPDAQTNQR